MGKCGKKKNCDRVNVRGKVNTHSVCHSPSVLSLSLPSLSLSFPLSLSLPLPYGKPNGSTLYSDVIQQ